MRPVKKNSSEVAREWDALAPVRERQLSKGLDISFRSVVTPALFRLLGRSDFTAVLDIGCGTGHVSEMLADKAGRLVAVDISAVSIELARRRLQGLPRVEVVNASVEDYARGVGRSFTLVIANMTLMTTLDLNGVVEAASRLLRIGGHFVFTITHPCFWPRYWGYDSADWFNYFNEVEIAAPFRITGIDTGIETTHIHRPLSCYFSSLERRGLNPTLIVEPKPTGREHPDYLKGWSFPRFLGVRCSLNQIVDK